MEIIRRIFKRKPKEKRTYTKLKDHGTDISFENEIKKRKLKKLKKLKKQNQV